MNTFYFIAGFLSGIAITFFVLKGYAKSFMIKENQSEYDFDETVGRLTASVEKHNWKMPHVHDLRAVLDKFGYKVNRVKVLEICKPEFAHKILSKNKERIASSFMPCRIAVYETEDGKVMVNRLRGKEVGNLFGGVISKTMKLAGDESEQIVHESLA
jgi:uncharacterized protein (DUF302 family)